MQVGAFCAFLRLAQAQQRCKGVGEAIWLAYMSAGFAQCVWHTLVLLFSS